MTLLAQPISLNDKLKQTAPATSKALSLGLTPVGFDQLNLDPLSLDQQLTDRILALDLGMSKANKNGTESTLLSMPIVDSTNAETTNHKDYFNEDYLALAEEAGLTNDYETRYKSETTLPVAASLKSLATTKVKVEKNSTTEVFVIRRHDRNANAKHVAAAIGLVCVIMFFMRMQDYPYLNSSKVLATGLPKFSAPVILSATMIMPAKNEIKKASSIKSLIVPKSPLAHHVAAKVPVKSKLQTVANLTNIRLASSTDNEVLNEVDKSILTTSVIDTVPPNSSKHLLKNPQVKLTSHMPTTAVDESLLKAYQALNHREYVVAQQQYQQVLQGDMRNIDALLGLAVIAQQQGRDADAQAWNEKVLEIEPRNAIALSLMANHQTNDDIIAVESSLKSMLAQQPEAASFHTALGNLYANQNQWLAAQEAFFNACHFAPDNADYAFNLAISLDHIAKYNLALQQYQRALKLLNLSGGSSPDRAQLETRIKALLSINIEK